MAREARSTTVPAAYLGNPTAEEKVRLSHCLTAGEVRFFEFIALLRFMPDNMLLTVLYKHRYSLFADSRGDGGPGEVVVARGETTDEDEIYDEAASSGGGCGGSGDAHEITGIEANESEAGIFALLGP